MEAKRFLYTLMRFVVRPVTVQPVFFLLLYILLNVLDIYSIAIFHSFSPLFKVISGFFFCYIFALPVILLPDKARKIYKSIVLLVAIVLFAVDIYLLQQYRETLNTMSLDAVAAVLATNPDETKDFFLVYFTADKLLVILFFISLLLSAFYYLNRFKFKWNSVGELLVAIFVVFSLIISVFRLSTIRTSNLYFLLTSKAIDLREYRHNPDVVYNCERPDNIVIILGESFSKHHSSLYGYEKQTNPLLEKMAEERLLFVFEDIESNAVSTIPAVKSIMMSYTTEMADSLEWYECLTLLEIMQKSGYSTNWISNQTKKGLMNNDVGCFSDLCDKQYFMDSDVLAVDKETCSSYFDERVIGVVEDFLSASIGKAFYIVHLMGSHYIYGSRYPETFSKFIPRDYEVSCPQLTYDNRKVVAEYDNSILYNDSVVYELMKCFENEDAVVFYFSDHGQDVFDSSNSYAGHAHINNPISYKAGIEVPFMVYTTPLFREKHPQLQERIERSVSTPYRTDSIMYTIMDVAGIETLNGCSYKHKSLFMQ